jgi:hypothetical protein
MGYSGHFVVKHSSVSDMSPVPQTGFRIAVDRPPVRISVLIDCHMTRGCADRLPGPDRNVRKQDS